MGGGRYPLQRRPLFDRGSGWNSDRSFQPPKLRQRSPKREWALLVFDGKDFKSQAHKQWQQGDAEMVEKSGQDARQGRIVKGGMMLKILILNFLNSQTYKQRA